jgi:ABC-type nitrate/sulfonate/bicarbonate transport system permease component
MKLRTPSVVLSSFIFLFLLFLWETTATSFIVSKPSEVILSFITILSYPNTWINILDSFIRVYISLAIAIVVGFAIGILKYFNKTFSDVVDSLVYPTQFIGAAVLTIIGIVFFGLSNVIPYFIITIVILPNIFITTRLGLDNLRKDLMEYGKTYSKTKFHMLAYIISPQLIPHVMAGIIRSNAVAWKIVVTAEIFIGASGLGFMINNYFRLLRIDDLFATVLIMFIVGFTMDRILTMIYNKILVRYDD